MNKHELKKEIAKRMFGLRTNQLIKQSKERLEKLIKLENELKELINES